MTDHQLTTPPPGKGVRVRNPKAGITTQFTNLDVAATDSVTFTPADTQPEPPPATGPSGIPVRPAPSGWRRHGWSHFDEDVPLGSWTGVPGLLTHRQEGALDSSDRGKYSAKRTMRQEDSLLVCGLLQDANGQRWCSCPMSELWAPSMRVTEVMRIDGPEAGWKIAHLVAPGGAVSKVAEYDFPECQLTLSPRVNGFVHLNDGDSEPEASFRLDQALGRTGACYEWHEYTIERMAGKWIDFLLDGMLLVNESGSTRLVTPGGGRHSVASNLVTTQDVHHVLQNETLLASSSIPAKMGPANILIDWYTIDVPA